MLWTLPRKACCVSQLSWISIFRSARRGFHPNTHKPVKGRCFKIPRKFWRLQCMTTRLEMSTCPKWCSVIILWDCRRIRSFCVCLCEWVCVNVCVLYVGGQSQSTGCHYLFIRTLTFVWRQQRERRSWESVWFVTHGGLGEEDGLMELTDAVFSETLSWDDCTVKTLWHTSKSRFN